MQCINNRYLLGTLWLKYFSYSIHKIIIIIVVILPLAFQVVLLEPNERNNNGTTARTKLTNNNNNGGSWWWTFDFHRTIKIITNHIHTKTFIQHTMDEDDRK